MCNATHHDPLFPRLTSANEVLKHIVYILDEIIVFFYQKLYDILCLMLCFCSRQIFGEMFLLKVFTQFIPCWV